MNCGKCGKKFKQQGRLSNHEEKCGRAPGEENPKANPMGTVIEILRKKRDEIIQGIPELARIDAAIAALEGRPT